MATRSSWRTLAKRQWRYAAWISGNGPWALVAPLRGSLDRLPLDVERGGGPGEGRSRRDGVRRELQSPATSHPTGGGDRVKDATVDATPPMYMTAAELARELRLHRATICRLAESDPTMPQLRIGTSLRFPAGEGPPVAAAAGGTGCETGRQNDIGVVHQ
jgi:hypothetical protein